MMVGRVIMTSENAPAISVLPRPSDSQNTMTPTSAKMMLGMPESVSVANSMAETSFLFVAYSVR